MYAKDRTTVIDRREMLQVKMKSLAAEARIIRQQELRSWGQIRDELHLHRVREVRFEARATHLAYGFIRGRTLEQMEERRNVGLTAEQAKAHDQLLFAKVNAMVKKYGSLPGVKLAA